MTTTRIILGPPGTGKTTRLLSILQEELRHGVAPTSVGFLAFTRQAALEGRDRCGLSEEQMPYFRTIHSFCFRILGMTPARVMGAEDYRTLHENTGLDFSTKAIRDGDWQSQPLGSQGVFLHGLARNMRIPLSEAYARLRGVKMANFTQLQFVADCIEKHKTIHHSLDFTDILQEFLAPGAQDPPLLQTLFVDEAQDLTPLQWDVIWRIVERSKPEHVYIAGDDDQAIFSWAGADVAQFIALEGNVETLKHSYRCPIIIQRAAARCLANIKKRRPKSWSPRSDPGSIRYVSQLEQVDMSEGKWLVLCRNLAFLLEMKSICEGRGWFFQWDDAPTITKAQIRRIELWEEYRREGDESLLERLCEYIKKGAQRTDPWYRALRMKLRDMHYIRACRRNGEDILKPPRIRLMSIHRAKGTEEENVVLLTDITKRSHEADTVEDQARLLYVAITRTRQSLTIVRPRKKHHFRRFLWDG